MYYPIIDYTAKFILTVSASWPFLSNKLLFGRRVDSVIIHHNMIITRVTFNNFLQHTQYHATGSRGDIKEVIKIPVVVHTILIFTFTLFLFPLDHTVVVAVFGYPSVTSALSKG